MPPERKAEMAIVVAFFVAAFLFLAPGYVRPDSIAVFAYLRSAVIDGDFAFFNEWASAGLVRDGITMFSEVTPNGALANHWWIGTAILSAPAYAIAHLAGAAPDGFSGLNATVLAWMNVAFAALTILIAWWLMRSSTSGRDAALALACTVAGTPFFWQTFRFPLGTHVAGALCVGWIFLALFGRAGRERDTIAGLAAGLAMGLAIAARLQHFVLIPAVAVAALRQRRTWSWWISAAAGGVLPLAAQAMAWNAIYGTPFGPLTRGASLAGTTWMPFQHVALTEVLLSSYHGLFSWSPVVLLAVVGWIASIRGERSIMAVTCLVMFAGEWIANGTFDRYFWGGMSFGARRFADLAVPIALGMVWSFDLLKSLGRAAAIAFTLWSVALIVAAHSGMLSLARYATAEQIVRTVFSSSTWGRAAAMPLHSAIGDGGLAAESLAAIAIVGIVAAAAMLLARSPRRAVFSGLAATAIVVLLVAIAAVRTRPRALASAAALGIDTVASARLGPLIDQRGLLRDEVAWARATGHLERAEETEREIAAIDGITRALRMQHALTRRSSSADASPAASAPSSPAPARP